MDAFNGKGASVIVNMLPPWDNWALVRKLKKNVEMKIRKEVGERNTTLTNELNDFGKESVVAFSAKRCFTKHWTKTQFLARQLWCFQSSLPWLQWKS